MKLIEVTKKAELDAFVASQPHSQLTQSWQWGELVEREGEKIRRWAVQDNNPPSQSYGEASQIIASASIIETKALGFVYWYCPKGPVEKSLVVSRESEILNFLFKELRNKAEKENIIFLRFEPDFKFQLQASSFQLQKTINLQPAKTLILDLNKSEKELLAQMHHKTRYNLRLAEKKGVVVSVGGKELLDEFWQLLNQTNKRDQFRLHPKEHYQNLMELDKNCVRLYLARLNGQAIAGAMVSYFGDTATYLHGGSANRQREVMAPYLVQWQAILDAKIAGFKYYDFFGIDEHKWPGVTRFKLGFGGNILEYPGTFDLVFKTGYYRLYNVLRRIRRWF